MILSRFVTGIVLLMVGWVVAQFPAIWIPMTHLIPFVAIPIFVYGVYKVWKA